MRPTTAGRRGAAAVAALAVASATLAPAGALAGAGGWSPAGALATPRWAHSQSLLGGPACSSAAPPSYCGRVLVAGGHTSPTETTAAAEIYDPASNQWSSAASMAAARSGHAAVVLDGTQCSSAAPPSYCGDVLVVGGGAPPELFDPGSGTWSPAGDTNVARGEPAAAVLDDGRVLVVGGSDGEARAELFDPATSAWTFTGAVDVPRRFGHSATKLADGRVLIAGGRYRPPSAAADVTVGAAEVFDPATETFTAAGVLFDPRFHHSATLLTDGRVAVAGGQDAAGSPRVSTELYTPGSGWSFSLDSMGTPHTQHAASLLTDGRLLVAGGGTILHPEVAIAEIYDPGADDWDYTGSLAAARRAAGATLLAAPGCGSRCGMVLVAGGASGSPAAAVAGAELFDPAIPAVPGAVTGLTATSTTPTSVELSFPAAGSNGNAPPPAADYVVKQSDAPITAANFDAARSLCGGECSFAPAAVGDELTLEVLDLVPGTTYHFAVAALAPGGARGPVSESASATTLDVPPGKVTDLTATARSSTKIRLEFSAVGANGDLGPPAGEYVVKEARAPIDSARDFRRARTLCGKVCTFSPPAIGARLRIDVLGRDPDTTYHYALRARDPAGNTGPRSNPAEATTLRRATRRVTLALSGHLALSGRVRAPDGPRGCVNKVPVVILRNGKRIDRVTTTRAGRWKAGVADRPGTYRAKAARVIRARSECLKRTSGKRRHLH